MIIASIAKQIAAAPTAAEIALDRGARDGVLMMILIARCGRWGSRPTGGVAAIQQTRAGAVVQSMVMRPVLGHGGAITIGQGERPLGHAAVSAVILAEVEQRGIREEWSEGDKGRQSVC